MPPNQECFASTGPSRGPSWPLQEEATLSEPPPLRLPEAGPVDAGVSYSESVAPSSHDKEMALLVKEVGIHDEGEEMNGRGQDYTFPEDPTIQVPSRPLGIKSGLPLPHRCLRDLSHQNSP